MILAVLLTVLGFAIVFANQNRLRAEIDDNLVRQATDATRGGRPPGPPPGDRFGWGPRGGPLSPDRRFPDRGLAGPRGPGGGPDPDGPGGGGPDRGGPPPDDMDGGPPHGPPNPYAAASRIADVRRPRFFNAQGKPLHEMDNPVPFDVNALSTSLAGKAAFANATYDGEPVRVYSRPILRAGHVEGAVQFARELTDLDILWAAQLRALAAVLPLAILAAAGAAFLLTGRTLRPVAQLTETADEIGRSGDLARRLEVTGDDEIAELARTFNDMLGRLDRSFQDLQEAFDKLGVAYEQQRRFAADASHELRTPLTRLRLATSAALAANSGPEEMRRALATADRAAEAMTNLVGQLLTLARADAGQLVVDRSAVDLRVIVAEGLDEIVGDRRVETCFAPTEVIVSADPEQLRRVVVNLVGNALRHSPATGSVTVKTGIENGEALLSVADTGEGIAPEHLPHLGERFYRVDAARNRKDGGAGLGLAICKNIVHAHGGRLTFASQVGVGTTVSVALPLFSEKKSSDPHSK